MQIVADLHLHSRYSRAVSQNMILPTMAQYAVAKGLDLLTASDWTHPLWMKEIQTLLEEKSEGVYQLKSGTDQMKKISFVLSVEISSIYKQGDKLRRIHNLVFAPSFTVAENITKALLKKGANLSADGRPIVGLTARDLLELVLSVDEKSFIIPCHVWTPHFGLYGSASGFDSIEEAFGDLGSYIYGVETGLSSDPEMNWNIPELQNRSILSFSDAHSPAKMGREATVLELEKVTYANLISAINRKSGKQENNHVLYTLEFYPEEGKYHYSGHRNCKVSFGPDDIREKGEICPVCKRKMTEGVFLRLQQLAGTSQLQVATTKTNSNGLKWFVDTKHHKPPYIKSVPLLEVVAEVQDSSVASQRTRLLYNKLTSVLGSELDILLKKPLPDIAHAGGNKIAEAISKVRGGNIFIKPGFDGEYGIVKIWGEDRDVSQKSDEQSASQMSLDL